MSFFTVSDTDPKTLSPAMLRKEVDEIKLELVKIETQIAEKRAWAVADGRGDQDLAAWLAKSRHFRKMLLCRYMLLRPLYRMHNQLNNSAKR